MSKIDLDPTDLVFLEPDEILRRTLWAARHRDLPRQEALDALLYAGYFTPALSRTELANFRDGKIALGLEKIQWDLILALAEIAERVVLENAEVESPGQWVAAWNQMLIPYRSDLKSMAFEALAGLAGGVLHPAFDHIHFSTEDDEPVDPTILETADQLALNALARVSAFMRSGHFLAFLLRSGQPGGGFNKQQFLEIIHKTVEPFVVIEPSCARYMGDFDGPDDEGKPNLILEGWSATHLGDPSLVSISIGQKKGRTGTVSATMFVIEQGGYPLRPGQRLAEHGVDFHSI
jgi:hypothetical protein